MTQQDFTLKDYRITRSCFTVTVYLSGEIVEQIVYTRIGGAVNGFKTGKQLIKKGEYTPNTYKRF